VHEVRVASRDEIVPSYRVPLDEASQAPVLMLGGLANPTRHNTNQPFELVDRGWQGLKAT